MMTYLQAVILGLLQGVTELFPISSLGHSIIIPAVFHWNISQNNNYFLIFLVATHLATALTLLGFFFADWKKIVSGIFRSLQNREVNQHDTYEKIGWLLIVGTIPAGILGLFFEQQFKNIFSSPRIVALFLIANGVLLYGVERLTRKKASGHAGRHDDARIAKLSWSGTVKIGLAQSLALIPGFSRTGATLGGGLLNGLNHEDAARFSFLLATPIILAAAVLKLPELIGNQSYALGPIIVGVIASAIAAYFSVKFLTSYFKTKTLTPFALYCVSIGFIAFVLLIR
jgi:undecaprenyl-diphosphatase